jgi:hypothetical protein
MAAAKAPKAKGESSQKTQGTTTVFDKHTKDATSNENASDQQGMGWIAKILIFIGFPTLVGFLGLYLAYLETIRKPEREIDFDTDFVIPFLLALSMCVVIGFQTRGYKSKQIEPLVQWPKIRRKKVIKKVVKNGGSADDQDDEPQKDNLDKKDK